MDKGFWIERWNTEQIGWHNAEVHPMLAANFLSLTLHKDDRVFVPLCGKTIDIDWLLSQGMRVVGIDLSENAVRAVFARLGLVPEVKRQGGLIHYSTVRLDIYVGDFFTLTPEDLRQVDAVYDRAALVALPPDMRPKYAAHLLDLTNKNPILAITFDYDQSQMPGPPFSVPRSEIKRDFGDFMAITLLESEDVKGGLKGVCAAQENVWLLLAG